MQTQRPSSMSTFVRLVSWGVSSLLVLAESLPTVSLAQTSANSRPVRIDNLTRMAPINQALKKQYETQFPDSIIEIQSKQPDAPLQLQPNGADLAAVSRLLTPEEKSQGLVQVPVTREKIAIVVGQDNPYAAGLTIDQAVKIFRGEITDWSQLGGQPGPIRVIHRPIASNLQSTLQTYDLFRQADFKAGGKMVQLDQNSISALSNELGQDGISYALTSQIKNAQAVRPVSMYNTLPDDPRYPFSQPFTYIYQGTPAASTKTFLDYVASKQGQAAIVKAKEQPTAFSSLDSDNVASTDPSSNPGEASAPSSAGAQDNTQSSNLQSESSGNPASPTTTSNESSRSESTPVASSSSDAADRASEGASGFGWLPIGLIILVIGGVVGGILKTLLAKNKPQKAPRPAPNYAEKIRPTRIQGRSTELQPPPEPSIGPANGEDIPVVPGDAQTGLTASAAMMGIAESESHQTPPENEPQDSETQSQTHEWVDITSKELQAQTRIQNPKTELQDTPPAMREPKTQLQDPTATQLQTVDDPEIAPAHLTESQDANAIPMQDSSEHLPQDLGITVLQEPSPTQSHDPTATFLQEPSPTQLQDSPVTQLQDSEQTLLQDPKQTWSQEEEFPNADDFSSTQRQDLNETQLQDPSQTQLQDPKQTWIQSEEFPKGQDPSVTQLQDPKRTWTQDNDG